MEDHKTQLFNFLNFLNNNKIRYVCIRGFLKLPNTADTDLDIVIHPEDFNYCLENMKLSKMNKTFKIQLITECIYEPCLTIGDSDNSMANGCFRIDLYNNFFYHYGINKYQIPLFYINIIFNCDKFEIPNSDIYINIPKPEFEISLLICRSIIDKNGKPIQKKHINRIENLIKKGIKKELLISIINSFCVTENSGILLQNLNNKYFKNYSLQNILNNKPQEHLKENPIFTFKINTNKLLVYQAEELNKISTYISLDNCNEFNYLYYKKNKNYFWKHYSQKKFDNLINTYDVNMYKNINVCSNYLTNYKYVWYDSLKMKYIPYLYINGICQILGEFDSPIEASNVYNLHAEKIFNYTYNKSKLINRNNLELQIRDGIHRSVINFNKDINVNFVYNLSKRPQNMPFEHEFHSFILWNNNNILENKILFEIDNTPNIKLEKIYEFNIKDRNKFVNNVYKKEREFYNFNGLIPITDERIKKNDNIKIIIIKDFIPMYYDNIKQNKNLPINQKIKNIKLLLRKNYSYNDFHSTDNISEHNEIINSILEENLNSEIIQYFN